MKKSHCKKFLGISIISWFTIIFEFIIFGLTIFYFGKNNDLKEKGLPDWVVYLLVVFLLVFEVYKLYLEFYENRIRDSFVNPEEILNSLYDYLGFDRGDVKLTLYKVLDNEKNYKSKGVQKLGQIVDGKAIEIEMKDFYSTDHLYSAIKHTPNYDYFEVRNITNPDFSQFRKKIGFSESFMKLYPNKIPKYWFYQVFKTRRHEVRLVLVIESVKQIKYFDSAYEQMVSVSNLEEANGLHNYINDSMLLNSLINEK